MKRFGIIAAGIFLFTAGGVPCTQAGEHPMEHPAGEQSAVTTDTIAEAIVRHTERESKRSGYFEVEDKIAKKTLKLKLDKVHKDRLSAVEKDLYFACVDFINEDGKSYDIDFFLRDGGGKLFVSETIVHKVEGKARYSWVKKGDFWVKKAAE